MTTSAGTTSYSYDNASRITTVTPPGARTRVGGGVLHSAGRRDAALTAASVGWRVLMLGVLWYGVRTVLPESPAATDRLSNLLYPWPFVEHGLPVQPHDFRVELRAGPSGVVVVAVGVVTYFWAISAWSLDLRGMGSGWGLAMHAIPLAAGLVALALPTAISVCWMASAAVQTLANLWRLRPTRDDHAALRA